MKTKTFTYQTRLDMSDITKNFFTDFAKLYGHIERCLFADYCKGKSLICLKQEYLIKYRITARQFNAIRITLQGKIDSIKSRIGDYIKDTENRVKQTKKTIKHLSKLKSPSLKQKNKLHQKQRLLIRQQLKLKQLISDKKQGKVRLCFGSKKLFHKQFHLQANGYKNFNEWKNIWEQTRNNQFCLIGSKDETMGNQSCIATLNEDSVNLKIRVPNCLIEKYGKFIVIDAINFVYGQEEIINAIKENIKRNHLSKKAVQQKFGALYKQHGQSINYRFLQDAKGWRLFVTSDKHIKKINSNKYLGAIGIDINTTHLSLSEIDHAGNLLNSFDVKTNLYGKRKNQAKAIIGDAVKIIVNYALSKNKPIIIEKLDFSKKKIELMQSAKRKRIMSSFAYSMIIKMLQSRAFRKGIGVYQVNPAYSSIIGRVKFARIYKISIHIAASLVIARRFFNFSEALPRCWKNIPDNKGNRVTLPGLVKIYGKHVWCSWAKVRKLMQAVHVAQYQMYQQPT